MTALARILPGIAHVCQWLASWVIIFAASGKLVLVAYGLRQSACLSICHQLQGTRRYVIVKFFRTVFHTRVGFSNETLR